MTARTPFPSCSRTMNTGRNGFLAAQEGAATSSFPASDFIEMQLRMIAASACQIDIRARVYYYLDIKFRAKTSCLSFSSQVLSAHRVVQYRRKALRAGNCLELVCVE